LDENQAIIAFTVQDTDKITIIDAADALVGLLYPKVIAFRFLLEAIDLSA